MGRVKVDIYKREREFHVTRLSDVEVVKGLITLRAHLDIYNDFMLSARKMESSSWKNVNQEIVALFSDLDKLIEKCLSLNQKALVRLLGAGLETQDVAELLGLNEKQIDRSLNSICKQIVKQNDRDWLAWTHLNYIESEWKTCRVCGEQLPATEKFFMRDDKARDGFRNDCVTCYNTTKRNKYFVQKVVENDILIYVRE